MSPLRFYALNVGVCFVGAVIYHIMYAPPIWTLAALLAAAWLCSAEVYITLWSKTGRFLPEFAEGFTQTDIDTGKRLRRVLYVGRLRYFWVYIPSVAATVAAVILYFNQ